MPDKLRGAKQKDPAIIVAFKNLNWSSVNRGDEVEILDNYLVIARGLVDDYTDDREILWLIPSFGGRQPSIRQTYGGGRRMLHRADGWDVRIIMPSQ